MVIFLYGPDSYRLKQNSNIVLDNYRKKYPGGVFFKFDLSNTDETEKVEDAVKSGSLFSDVKLLILKNVFSNKAGSDRIGELIRAQNILKEKDTVLLIIENQEGKELAKNRTLFNLLAGKDPAQSNSADRHEKGRTLGGASNIVRNIEYLEGEKLTKWIKGEFALRKCSIEPDVTKELIAIAGNESWALVNEIDKLCNFSAGGVIKKEDVTLLSSKKIDLNIFDFVDAIAGKNKLKAYEILFKEIKNSRDPYYLLTMMVYGFRGLLTVKDLSDRGMSLDSITKKSRLHPFVARKTYQSAEKFSLAELKSIYGLLLDLDTRSKEGIANLTDSLFAFVLN
ncbi:MAG: polymerase III, delta subunit protein [Candidatus Yanofskybacteria bacterium GW2011_GWA1_41_6]|uniref:DNA polymerase III subunit delta n=1 Tax=Candidatus Yanofskybacteria bacterium GW2011_GWA1_41_6 TaxID=1619020 RepID=A0A0G0WMJ5_9BACT|nr:MAG: polymerase III, delta subunit protein [Candidatus Yanofskybacteria bacterium GW2011_GWA1_41_6]